MRNEEPSTTNQEPRTITSPRVFHLVYSLIRGGSEGQCARVVLGLAERGWVQRVGVSVREGFFLDRVEEACGPVHVLGIDRMLSWKTAQRVRALADLLRKGSFDLLHAWDADASLFGPLAARLAGIPYLTSQRDMGEIYAPWKWRLICCAHRGASAVVVNAHAIAELVSRRGVPRGCVQEIPNLLDVAEFDRQAAIPFSCQERLPPPPRAMAVARLDPEKNTSMLLMALRILLDRGDRVSLVIAGDGVERARLEQEARSRGLEANVCFLGESPDVPSLLRQAQIGVLSPSSNEGLSNSILEYMAAGLPCIVTDCGGNRELVVHGETGFVVPSGDVDAMAEAMHRLVREPVLAADMGRRGRARVLASFTPAPVLDRFARLYETMGRRPAT